MPFFLEGNHIWRTGWSYKSETGPFWPGLWSCFMSSLQNFAVLETGSWVWGWNVFNSGNLLDLDSLWNHPFRLYQLPLQVVGTRANRWLCSNPDVSPTERDRPVEWLVINHQEGRSLCCLDSLEPFKGVGIPKPWKPNACPTCPNFIVFLDNRRYTGYIQPHKANKTWASKK